MDPALIVNNGDCGLVTGKYLAHGGDIGIDKRKGGTDLPNPENLPRTRQVHIRVAFHGFFHFFHFFFILLVFFPTFFVGSEIFIFTRNYYPIELTGHIGKDMLCFFVFAHYFFEKFGEFGGITGFADECFLDDDHNIYFIDEKNITYSTFPLQLTVG
jgi:hypothetical protein